MSLSSLVENSLFKVSQATAIMSFLNCIACFRGLMHSVWQIEDIQTYKRNIKFKNLKSYIKGKLVVINSLRSRPTGEVSKWQLCKPPADCLPRPFVCKALVCGPKKAPGLLKQAELAEDSRGIAWLTPTYPAVDKIKINTIVTNREHKEFLMFKWIKKCNFLNCWFQITAKTFDACAQQLFTWR